MVIIVHIFQRQFKRKLEEELFRKTFNQEVRVIVKLDNDKWFINSFFIDMKVWSDPFDRKKS